jgi:hypothetical protein
MTMEKYLKFVTDILELMAEHEIKIDEDMMQKVIGPLLDVLMYQNVSIEEIDKYFNLKLEEIPDNVTLQ